MIGRRDLNDFPQVAVDEDEEGRGARRVAKGAVLKQLPQRVWERKYMVLNVSLRVLLLVQRIRRGIEEEEGE